MKISCQKEEGGNSGNCPFEDNHLCSLTKAMPETHINNGFYVYQSPM